MAEAMAEAMTRTSSMQRGMPGTEPTKPGSAATTMAPGKQRGKPREQRGKSDATMTMTGKKELKHEDRRGRLQLRTTQAICCTKNNEIKMKIN